MNHDKHIQNYNILTDYIYVVLNNMSYLSWGCTLDAEGTRDRWGSPAMPQVQCPIVPPKKPQFFIKQAVVYLRFCYIMCLQIMM